MSTTCPQCSYENPDQSSFCVRCGNRLQPSGQSGNSPMATYSPGMASAPPNAVSYSPFAQSYLPPPTQTPPAQQSWAPNATSPTGYPLPSPAQMGTGQGLASIRRAFAGRGTLIMHHSWLLDGKHVEADSVRTAIKEMLQQRNFSGLNIFPERLMEKGLMMEERDYLTVRRGVSTVFVYAAPAGNDLYISRATTVLPLISYARAVILGLLFMLLIIALISQQTASSSITPFGTVSISPTAVLLGLLFYPLLLFFIIFLVRSFINWLFEKDFWIYLRPNTLNDFQLDDIALLEHGTDYVVRDAVAQLGLDASKIVPPAPGYQPKRKYRAI